MKKTRTSKYRLILSFSEQDVAFEKLYLELIAIESEFSNDATLMSQAKRKHFMKILLLHCNQNLQSYQTNSQLTKTKPIPSQILEVTPTTESNTDPPTKQAPSPPPTPPPLSRDKNLGAENITKAGLAMQDQDVISFGEFKLVIK